jgi:hypothetical protein
VRLLPLVFVLAVVALAVVGTALHNIEAGVC